MLLLVLLAFSCLLTAPTTHAQVGAKAYAPENLSQLAVPDRIRVLEREYEEQSGGRRLPDDQLEFYLDQIQSGWTFGRIKQDIAESLRGSTWTPPAQNWQPRELICSSERGRRIECRTPFTGPAVLSQQISREPCIEGRTWGQRRGLVWVDLGCRARFREDGRLVGGGNPGAGFANSVICESREGRLRRCATSFRFGAELVEQYSNAPCIQGTTWDARPGEVWVSRGCRARFVDARGSLPGLGRPPVHGGYSVTCGSVDGRERTCAWTDRGRPYLIEQLSRAACIEGRTWGHDRSGLWVRGGCYGRFGSR